MNLGDFLGLGATPGMAQPMAQPMPQAMPQAAVPQGGGGLLHGGLKVGSPVRNFLGALGDALLVSSGHQPLYQQRLQQQRQQNALQGFLTDPDAAIAQLMRVDAPSAIELYAKMHHQEAMPDAIQTYEYRNRLPEDQRPAFDKFQQLMHPGLFAPVTLGPGDTVAMPGATGGGGNLPSVSSPEEAAKLPPGTQFRMPDGRIGTVPGGQTASPSGNFPVEKVMDALTHQESGGNGLAVSPKGALGSTQLLPGTAKEMANKLGLAFVPQMLRSNDPKALAYQRALAQAYFQQGLQQTGNVRDALRYYHGGPDTSMWGPKTNAYADAILARLGGM